MISVLNTRKIELDNGLTLEDNVVLIGLGDDNANTFEAELYSGGEPVQFTTVKAYFIRPDGATVVMDGTVDGNKARVTLSADCYYYAGAFILSLQVDSLTVRRISGNVVTTSSDVIVDNETTYSLAELMALINGKVKEPAAEGLNGQVLSTDGRGGRIWRDPNILNIASKVTVGSTTYTLRTGTAGASGYLTIVTG